MIPTSFIRSSLSKIKYRRDNLMHYGFRKPTHKINNLLYPLRKPRIALKYYSTDVPDDDDDLVTTKWILKDGSVKITKEKEGMNLLDVAHKNDIDLEGACEASLACSTCHVIIEDEDFFELTGEPTDEENDMLDLAFGLTETSRLGCQVILTKDLDNMVVRLPAATRNMMVDGYIPPKH